MLIFTHSPRNKRYLLGFSFILYILSLWLPAYGERLFYVDEGPNYYFGIEVLLLGLIFGWMGIFGHVGALAGYANLFYGFAMYQAYKKGTTPIKSTMMMVVLSLLSFLHQEDTGDRGISFGDYISVWGWGAVLWFFAFGILAMVVIGHYYHVKLPKLRYVVLVFIVLIVSLIKLQDAKLQHMGEMGAQRFGSPAIAYMRIDKDLLDYHPLPHQLKPHPMIAIQGDFNAVTAKFDKWYRDDIAMPPQFLYNGMLWQRYDLCFDEQCQMYKLTPTTQRPDYHYSVKLTDERVNYQLNKDNRPIWQATAQVNGFGGFPYYKDDLMAMFEHAGLTLPNQNSDNFSQQVIDFTQSPSCKIDKVFADKNLIQIKGQLLHTTLAELNSYHLWCSENYYLMVQPQVKLDHEYSRNFAVVFDKNLTPLQQFIWREAMSDLTLADGDWDKLSPEQQALVKKDIETSPDSTLIQQITIMPNPHHTPNNNYTGSVITAKTNVGSFYYRIR